MIYLCKNKASKEKNVIFYVENNVNVTYINLNFYYLNNRYYLMKSKKEIITMRNLFVKYLVVIFLI